MLPSHILRHNLVIIWTKSFLTMSFPSNYNHHIFFYIPASYSLFVIILSPQLYTSFVSLKQKDLHRHDV